MERLSLRFDGGIASEGRLHFYEYTRSQYASARFISTIEHFRRTGEVSKKITRNSYVEIIVETPREGSFHEVLLVAVKETVASAVSVQLGSLISLVWETLLPRSQKTDSDVVELARIRLAEEQARASARTTEIQSLEKIVSEENATTRQALDLVEKMMGSSNPSLGRANLDQRRLSEMQEELSAESSRNKQIERDRAELETIPIEDLSELTSRLRPMLPEMAKPLNRSAATLQIESGERDEPLVLLNPTNVAEITAKQLEEKSIEINVHVRSYDRDRGVGKVTSADLPRQLNFVVPPSEQGRLLRPILSAMMVQSVQFRCRRYLDKSGLPTSLVLENIVDQ